MSISCCDPKKEPKLVEPNHWKLNAQEWIRVSVSVPSLITPDEQPQGIILAYPTRFPSGAGNGPGRYTPENGISVLLPSAGNYNLFYDALDPRGLEVTTFDSRDPSATEIYHKPGYNLPVQTATTMLAGSTSVLVENIRAKYRLFVNASANPIYLSQNLPAAIGTGIYLQANGGSFEQYGPTMYRGRVSAAGILGSLLLTTEAI